MNGLTEHQTKVSICRAISDLAEALDVSTPDIVACRNLAALAALSGDPDALAAPPVSRKAPRLDRVITSESWGQPEPVPTAGPILPNTNEGFDQAGRRRVLDRLRGPR